ncbi:MAG: extracellular solute-binding protein, partial [Deltaproteobacteria bacterium]|nr:extracellular solute-binding protein [Deltaproteobacteria bacterium]
ASRDASESRDAADVMFGGGISDHQALAEKNLSRAVKFDDAAARIPAEVAGLPTRDKDGKWIATGLSSFGFVFNDRDAARRNIAAPKSWDDLADPRFAGWLGIADPEMSSSHRACMVVVLEKYGWNEGWSRLIRMLANSRGLVERSAAALQQTRNGIFLASFAVNFDGLESQAESGNGLKYVNPPGATAVTPDAISVLATSRDPEIAELFAKFVLSEDGQRLWIATPEKGDERRPLYHYPIDPKAYELAADKRCLPDNPLTADFGLKYDLEKAKRYEALIGPLVEAACGDNHVALQQAWQAVAAAGVPAAALAELTKPPLDEAGAAELGKKYRDASADEEKAMRQRWSEEFAERYRKVLALTQQKS